MTGKSFSKLVVPAVLAAGLIAAAPATASPTVTVTPSPTSLAAPGGSFTFAVVVRSPILPGATASDSVTSMTDSVYGTLANECGPFPKPTPISCSYTRTFNGVAGQTQTDTVTANASEIITPDMMAPLPATNVTGQGSTTISLTPGATTAKKKCPKGKKLVKRKGKKKCVKKKKKS